MMEGALSTITLCREAMNWDKAPQYVGSYAHCLPCQSVYLTRIQCRMAVS